MGGDRKVTAFALTHWMKIFWVKTPKSVVESYEEAIIFLQINIFENKRNVLGFALTQNFCGNTVKNQKIFIQYVKVKFLTLQSPLFR